MKKVISKFIRLVLVVLMGILMLAACAAKASSAPETSAQSAPELAPENKMQETEAAQQKEEEAKSEEPNQSKETAELIISAAASLKEAMGEIQTLYKIENPNISLVFNFGSSGSLQQQIEQGAPVDVFFSAALKQMKGLEDKDLIEAATKRELLENKVVLITPKDKIDLKTFEDLGTDKVKKIGLGEFKSVPAGQYAEEILTKFAILDQVKPKAVYGKDIKTVLAWVETGEVDAGVVYATDAKGSDKVNIVCGAPEGSHKPVLYPVAAVKGSKHVEEAKLFIDYLSSDAAKEIFQKYGFETK